MSLRVATPRIDGGVELPAPPIVGTAFISSLCVLRDLPKLLLQLPPHGTGAA